MECDERLRDWAAAHQHDELGALAKQNIALDGAEFILAKAKHER